MNIHEKQQLVSYLLPYVTRGKQEKMEAVLAQRTRHITVVIEDIFQSHNANAVVRSSECFGIQDLHVIEDRYKFAISSGVAMGSTKWVDVHRYTHVGTCITALRSQGYRIVATTPHTNACMIDELPLDPKIALIFGTENAGLSPYALEHADEFVKIPMYGFTQSFNISVSVAICLQILIPKLHQSSLSWQLSDAQKLDIMLIWLGKTIRAYDQLVDLFFKEQQL